MPFCDAMGAVPSVLRNSAWLQPVSPIQLSEMPFSAACLMRVADSTEPAWTMTASGFRSAIFWATAA